MQRAAGLQFRAVILDCADPDDPLVGGASRDHGAAMGARYVAMSRAQARLVIYVSAVPAVPLPGPLPASTGDQAHEAPRAGHEAPDAAAVHVSWLEA